MNSIIKERTNTSKGTLMLIRHAERPPIPEGSFGNELPITQEGERASRNYGKRQGVQIHAIHSSPVKRCMGTASNIINGSGQALTTVPDTMLGAPGAFISNTTLAEKSWNRHGHEGVCHKLFFDDTPMPGFYPPQAAASAFLRYMVSNIPPQGRTTLFVTHDIIIAALAVRLLDLKDEELIWPDFLDGIEITLSDDDILLKYRDTAAGLPIDSLQL